MNARKRLAALAQHVSGNPVAASYDDILAAHYSENPHVAAQLKVGAGAESALPKERMNLATADDVLAAHYRENPHVAAQLKVSAGGGAESALPKERMNLATADDVLAAHYRENPHVAAQLKTTRDATQALQSPQQRLTTGQGELTFELVPELLALPAGLEIKNAHGMAVDGQGNIYLTYDSETVTATSRALVKWAPDGTSPHLVGSSNALAVGTPHGLRYSEEGGEQYLYHANNSGLSKSTLDGEIIWTNMQPLVWKGMAYAPTDCLVVPGSDNLIVADGYGSSFVHLVNKSNGQYAGITYGGKGDTASPDLPTRFNCNHGMGYDQGRGLLVYTDRANNRLVYTQQDGTFHSEIPLGQGGMSLPCNVDVNAKENLALVASLGTPDKMSDGAVGIVCQSTGKVVSTLEIANLLGGHGHMHPHDALWLPNGDVIVSTWNPGRLSYWRRTN